MDAVKHGGGFSWWRLSYCENKTIHVSCAQTRNCPKNQGSGGKNMQLSISSPFLPRFQEKRTRRRIVVQKSSYLPETITFLRAFKWMRYMSNDFSAVSGTNPEYGHFEYLLLLVNKAQIIPFFVPPEADTISFSSWRFLLPLNKWPSRFLASG